MGHAERTIRIRLCNEATAPSTLRRAVDEVAEACDLADEARFDLKLAATEALTNAIKGTRHEHAVEVVVSGSGGSVDVEVLDRGRFEARIREEEPQEAEGGRGIPLMLALVDEVEFASAGDSTRVRVRKHSARPA
jgi:anti-sigma regulatory factor (Ser/Thr protein kinase)